MAGELEFSEKLQVYKETPKEKEKISKFRLFPCGRTGFFCLFFCGWNCSFRRAA
mgnify:CR=1 FL=1